MATAIDGGNTVDTTKRVLLPVDMLLGLDTRVVDNAAVGVLATGVLASSQVKTAAEKSCSEAVVVPVKTAMIFAVLAIIRLSRLRGVMRWMGQPSLIGSD